MRPHRGEDIIDLINAGQDVSYKNSVIVGDLDFRTLDDVTADKPLRKLRIGRFSSQSYTSHVRSSLSFIDCTFTGDVLAYVHIDKKNETYNAVFYEDVNFQGCAFEEASAFKYTKISEPLNLDGVEFEGDSDFKYTKIEGRSFTSYLLKNRRRY
jgi:hypothetical protein